MLRRMKGPWIGVVVAFVVAVIVVLGDDNDADPVATNAIHVIDGDTIRVDRHNVRLTGFNTPETRFAECEAERALGYEAKAALLDLIKRAERVEVVYQTNADGSYHLDKYQRRLGRLMIDGENAGRILIERDLAEPYSGGRRRDWCG